MAQDDRTKTFTVDAIAPDESVTTQSRCGEVTIFENGLAGTLDYSVRDPFPTSAQVLKAAGTPYTFKAPPGTSFPANTVVGYVSVASGSMTMAQEEK